MEAHASSLRQSKLSWSLWKNFFELGKIFVDGVKNRELFSAHFLEGLRLFRKEVPEELRSQNRVAHRVDPALWEEELILRQLQDLDEGVHVPMMGSVPVDGEQAVGVGPEECIP